MSKFEKSFAGGSPLKADELNQMVAAINDNDDQIASLREETDTKLNELEGQNGIFFKNETIKQNTKILNNGEVTPGQTIIVNMNNGGLGVYAEDDTPITQIVNSESQYNTDVTYVIPSNYSYLKVLWGNTTFAYIISDITNKSINEKLRQEIQNRRKLGESIMSMFVAGVNKYNKESKDNLDNCYISSHKVQKLDGYSVTGPIFIEKNTIYRFQADSNLGKNVTDIIITDNKGNDIGYTVGKIVNTNFVEFSLSSDGYVRVNVGLITKKSQFMICKKTEYPEYYVPFMQTMLYLSLNELMSRQVEELNDIFFKNLQDTGVNKFNKNSEQIIPNRYIAYNGLDTLNGHYVSHPIQIKKDKTYKFKEDGNLGTNNIHIIVCDIVGSIDEIIQGTRENGYVTFSIAKDCYVRVNIGRNINSFMLCLEEEYPIEYTPYKTFISGLSLNPIMEEEVKEITKKSKLWGKKLAIDGDSIAEDRDGRVGDDNGGGFGKIIALRNNMVYAKNVTNLAVGGGTIASQTYTSSGQARHWICESVANLPVDSDYILVDGGVNDPTDKIGEITTGFDATLDTTTYCGGFEQMCKTLCKRFAGKKYGYVFVHRMTTSFDYTGNDNNKYWLAKKILEKWGIPYIDLNRLCPPFEYWQNSNDTELQQIVATYVPDGWHPNKDGYEKYYCDKIEEWMQSL